ncbi:MAG: Gx transporter family protein [Actinobacteria bacterium]|nr:Gx transporter family protein [Actinomycetota bacterium]
MSSTVDRSPLPGIPPSDRRAYLVSRLGLLVTLGLVLQILEGMLPPILPLPGVKLGLANLATLIALFTLGPWEALAVNLLRCLLGGLLRGSFVGLTISLSAGTAATLVMAAVYLIKPPFMTLTGLSIAGAVSHNAAQLGVAVWLVGFPGLVNYLPILLLLALPTGFLIGLLARRLLLSLGAGYLIPVASPRRAGGGEPRAESQPGGWTATTVPAGGNEIRTGRVRKAETVREPAIFLEGVTIWFPGREDRPALDGLHLVVEEGEFVALTGLNGSGKSTLCRLVNGLLLPGLGRVRVFGLDTSSPEDLREIRRLVGMILQDPDHQVVGATVEDDVAFGPENLGLPREEISIRVEEALSLAGVTHLRRRQPHLLSPGEKKRVALAGVLALRPRVVVSDESTSMLDPVGRSELLDLLRRQREERGVTLLHVTHRPEEFLLADRLVLLEEGRVTFDGPPHLFLSLPRLRERIAAREPEPLRISRELRGRGWPTPEHPRGLEDILEGLWASP